MSKIVRTQLVNWSAGQPQRIKNRARKTFSLETGVEYGLEMSPRNFGLPVRKLKVPSSYSNLHMAK
jgi:hypothetical protein